MNVLSTGWEGRESLGTNIRGIPWGPPSHCIIAGRAVKY